MASSVWKAAMLGGAQGAVMTAVLFLTNPQRTFANDWFLAVMIVFATTTGAVFAARFGLNVVWVAVAGVLGIGVGGWLGVEVIGSYEYRVPTPEDDKVVVIIANGQKREVKRPGAQPETVKRIPIGGGVGVLAGWLAGLGTYTLVARYRQPGSRTPHSEVTEPREF